MPRPVHFELPADQPERLIAFYEKAFGWKFTKWDGPMPYWMVSTGSGADEPGIDGGVTPRAHPGQTVANTIAVANLDEAIAAVIEAGGTITVPRMPIPGIGWLAYFNDTEGNPGGLMQNDPAAA